MSRAELVLSIEISPIALQAHLLHNRAARDPHLDLHIPDDGSTTSMPLMTATRYGSSLHSRPSVRSRSFENDADTASFAICIDDWHTPPKTSQLPAACTGAADRFATCGWSSIDARCIRPGTSLLAGGGSRTGRAAYGNTFLYRKSCAQIQPERLYALQTIFKASPLTRCVP